MRNPWPAATNPARPGGMTPAAYRRERNRVWLIASAVAVVLLLLVAAVNMLPARYGGTK